MPRTKVLSNLSNNEILLMYVDEDGTHYEHYTPERLEQIITKFKK